MPDGDSSNEAKRDVPENANEDNAECMGCKTIAFTTPLLISSYLIYHHYSLEKVRQLPFAADWTGPKAWKVHVHRFNLCVVVPLTLCYSIYAHMFKFGPFAPNALNQSKTVAEEAKADMDSFTRGTLQLADWVSSSTAEKKDVWKETWAKLKHMFSFDGRKDP